MKKAKNSSTKKKTVSSRKSNSKREDAPKSGSKVKQLSISSFFKLKNSGCLENKENPSKPSEHLSSESPQEAESKTVEIAKKRPREEKEEDDKQASEEVQDNKPKRRKRKVIVESESDSDSEHNPGPEVAINEHKTDEVQEVEEPEVSNQEKGVKQQNEDAEMEREEEEAEIDEEETEDEGAEEDSSETEEVIELEHKAKKKKSNKKSASKASAQVKPFDPIKNASWTPGPDIPYLEMARLLSLLQDEAGRLLSIEMLSNFFRSVIATSPSTLLPCVYLAINAVGPSWEGLEIGVGDQLLLKAISQSTGRSLKHLREMLKNIGDLGVCAEKSRTTQKTIFAPKPLTIKTVLKCFRDIAAEPKADKKLSLIKRLLVSSRESEARFIVRAMQGNLRIGCSLRTVLPALARAVVLSPPGDGNELDRSLTVSSVALAREIDECNKVIRRAWCEVPSLDVLVPSLVQHGYENLMLHCHLTAGIPVRAMLANPAQSIGQILKSFDGHDITLEYKYDGERAQIHLLEDGSVKIFSRNLEDNTSKYPDLIEMLPKTFGACVKSCILDSEIVAFDPIEKRIRPFQVLSTRKRKDVEAKDVEVQVAVFAFDMLYLNGNSLLDHTLRERRQLLVDNFKPLEDKFFFAEHKDSNDVSEIREYLAQSITDNCEGLMVKSLDHNSNYEPDKRSHAWIKLKKDYLEGAADTFDLVPIGGYYGKGKRTGWFGGFLLACYDPESEQYQSLTKIGTGFSDEALSAHANFLKQHEIKLPRSYFVYPDKDLPDVWFEPRQVWEVKASDLSISPHHKAAIGIVDETKGIALRFPRFVRVRDDKNPEDATTSEQVAEFYHNQVNKI